MTSIGRTFVYLAYMDDSETKSRDERWKVVSGAVVSDDAFSLTEIWSSLAIEHLMPEDKRDKFEEFHACELYGGYGPFDGIEQSKRLGTIEYLLDLLRSSDIHVTYGAVDIAHLQKQPYASANPLDIAFRLCAQEIDGWLLANVSREMQTVDIADVKAGRNFALLIADDCDKADRAILQKSFRSMRRRMRPSDLGTGTLLCLHDDMYFGDSRYSIGIQLADLCAYFIARHLMGHAEIDYFYKMIEPRIVRGTTEG